MKISSRRYSFHIGSQSVLLDHKKHSPTSTSASHGPVIDSNTICNGSSPPLADIVFFGRLQMVSELVTRWCESLVGVGLDPPHSRRILKP